MRTAQSSRLVFRDLVAHDRDGWHAQGVESNDVIEAFDHDDAATGDCSR